MVPPEQILFNNSVALVVLLLSAIVSPPFVYEAALVMNKFKKCNANAKNRTIEGEANTRAVVQIKNNLAAFGHAKAFELSESGFQWLGDYEITVDEVLGGIAPKANKMEQAKKILRELAETQNAVQSNEVFELAEEHGISKRTMENAKKELGIKAKKINNAWYWELDKIGL